VVGIVTVSSLLSAYVMTVSRFGAPTVDRLDRRPREKESVPYEEKRETPGRTATHDERPLRFEPPAPLGHPGTEPEAPSQAV